MRHSLFGSLQRWLSMLLQGRHRSQRGYRSDYLRRLARSSRLRP